MLKLTDKILCNSWQSVFTIIYTQICLFTIRMCMHTVFKMAKMQCLHLYTNTQHKGSPLWVQCTCLFSRGLFPERDSTFNILSTILSVRTSIPFPSTSSRRHVSECYDHQRTSKGSHSM